MQILLCVLFVRERKIGGKLIISAQEICEEHNVNAVLIHYKDGSNSIHISREAEYTDGFLMLNAAFKKQEGDENDTV